uniref:Fucosyltransferase n=1 Tax=Oryza meridionalis TaxID=40149 RepID=A0A0E0CRV8_9ORYZ
MHKIEKAARWGWRVPVEVAVVGFVATLTFLVLLSGGTGSLLSFNSPRTEFVQKLAAAAASPSHGAPEDTPETSTRHDDDRLLGGLLSPAFDEHSCRSRYTSSLYRRRSPFRPSTYLVERLRRYEARHKRCGPGSALFQEAVEHLRSGRNAARSECQYVVWTPFNGLGNRMLALASTFLYALLTNRVLLVHAPPEFDGLFCEPFPGSSWTLPADFPIIDFDGVFTMWSPTSYKNMRQAGTISNATAEQSLPAYVFLDLIQSFTDAAFCDDDQQVLAKFNWMVIKSDVYFAAMFFLMPAYERELAQLFPEKEAVFHHLARYLFHPSNDVWGIVHRFYEAYLSKADELVGLQVRVFPEMPIPFDNMYEQIIRCSEHEGLLPKLGQTVVVTAANGSSAVAPSTKLTSILVTSLFPDYYDRIRGVYHARPTETGEYVAVHQPSHEREQHTEARGHNQRALAEIYLLSFCDRVVTSAVSTFGYIAHGLAGVRPWVLLRPPSPVARAEPACVRSETVEPCLQALPRRMCGAAEGSDIGTLVPHIRHCEDVQKGVKLGWPPAGPAAENEARRWGRLRRASARAALVLCSLTMIPVVVVLHRCAVSSSWSDRVLEAKHIAGAGEQDDKELQRDVKLMRRLQNYYMYSTVPLRSDPTNHYWHRHVVYLRCPCNLRRLLRPRAVADAADGRLCLTPVPLPVPNSNCSPSKAALPIETHMERSGGGADGDEERLPLHHGFETERATPWAAAESKPPPRGRFGRASVRAALAVCFLAIPAVLLLQRWQAGSSPEWLFEIEPPADGDRDMQDDLPDDLTASQYIGYDKFLGGLLQEGFDEVSCRSRYQFARYHKNSTRIPSSYLLERLRRQEALQKKCGPGTKSYKQAVKLLRSSQGVNMTTDCNYLFLIVHAGLGNRMLEIASAFLYALLTNRILLLDRYQEIGDLFCEPFPGTSWLMPSDFPLNYGEFTQSSPESYGNMLQNKVVGDNTDRSLAGSRPPYVFLYLDGNYEFHDKLFFCEDDQQFLQDVPWLIMRTDMYFIPSLFLIPSYQDELSRLFPEKDAVFHHLARYLFHPMNSIWYSVKGYYRSYLAKANKTVGIQIRIFEKEGILQKNGRFPYVLEQILSCAQNEKLLPEISMKDEAEAPTATKNNQTIAVLTASLSSWYSDQIQKKYSEHPTVDGTRVEVYQPSHEEYQRSKNKKHNMKALAEIYLLSMTDVLITSGFSTFGYAAQGLSGLTPWIMFRSENHAMPDPPCRRAMSIEPCFHQAPFYDCKAKRNADLGKMVPFVRHCEDVSWGLKVVLAAKSQMGVWEAELVGKGSEIGLAITLLPLLAVQQRKPKACAESAAAARGADQQQGDCRQLEAGEEALERSVPRKRKPAAAVAAAEKRWSSVAYVVLAAFVMATVFAVLGSRRPAVWIAATKALRRGSDDKSIPLARSAADKLLGGLLPEGFDEKSCRSRYESSLYRRNPGRRPSPHLVARLRMHEELQRRCGPNTESYNRAVQRLRDGGAAEADAHSPDDEQCKYVVSISYRGLGNRILAAASAFLYAVLTGRVLLVDPSNEMDELLCEPFPGTTWLLPRDFPLASSYANFSADTAESYGNMLKNKHSAPHYAVRSAKAI